MGGWRCLLGVVFGVGLIDPYDRSAARCSRAFALVVTVGMVDDRFSVSPGCGCRYRPGSDVDSLGTRTEVLSLGNPFGTGLIHFHGLLGHGLTICSS